MLTFSILLFGAGGPALRGVTDDPTTGYLIMGAVSGVVIAIGMLVATTVARRPVTGAPPATSAAAGRGRVPIREHYAGRHPSPPSQRAVPCPAVDVRAAGARDGSHARRRAVRRDVGDALRRRRAAAVRRADRPGALRGPRLGMGLAAHRQGALVRDRQRRSSRSPRCRSSGRCGRPATGSTRRSPSPASPTPACSRCPWRCCPT